MTPVVRTGTDRPRPTPPTATADRRTPRPKALAAVLLGALLGTLLAAPARAEDPPAAVDFTQQTLFRAAADDGYACFRIPAVVRTTQDTLLAFAEGRVNGCSDAGDIDIVVRRSTDGGRSWGPVRVVTEENGDTHGNPAPVVDRRTGRILLAQTWNEGRTDGRNCPAPCERIPHLQYSDDDGLSWSEPEDVSDAIRPPGWDSWYATGPVHGIQLRHGPHAGRLVFGVNAASWDGGRVTHNHAALAVSDDGGRTWRLGATDTRPRRADGTHRQQPQELSVLERGDGAVLVSARETSGTDLGHRTQAVSTDGGTSFAAPFRALPDLYTPQVQGSVLRLGDSGRLLLSAPADPDRRRTMMIRSSWDEGRTWESVDRGKVVTTDWSGYSDLVRATDDHVGLLYEGGPVDARDEIRFARFTEEWLGERRGPDPTTRDLARRADPALVLGGARTVPDGRFGRAVTFDGENDAVRLPFRDSLPLHTDDFTASLWFRHRATGGDQPLLWMGGVGRNQPHVALVADPAGDRITAEVVTRGAASAKESRTLSVPGARADGRWHHAVLRRSDGTLSLTVDGDRAVTTGVTGTVSSVSPFGVHVGQKVDSRAHFTGALDEVRVYDRVVPDDRLDGPASPSRGLVLGLPLDHIRQPR